MGYYGTIYNKTYNIKDYYIIASNGQIYNDEYFDRMFNTFDGRATLLDEPIIVGNKVTEQLNILGGRAGYAKGFNSPVQIGRRANCAFMFNNCNNFNQPIAIPDGVTNCAFMFFNCNNLTAPITLGSGPVSTAMMFRGCTNYPGTPITIPKETTDANAMFEWCYNFNAPVIFAENSNLKSCAHMFNYCRNFNQDVIIPNGVTNCANLLQGCYNFRGTVVIPETAYDCRCLCASTNVSNLYLKVNLYSGYNYYSFISMRPTDPSRINIFTNNTYAFRAYFSPTKDMGWTSITEEGQTVFYNATNNIYIYNNYT